MRKGFSINEFLTVVAIMAVLAAIAIPCLIAAQREDDRRARPHACGHQWHENRCREYEAVTITKSMPDGTIISKQTREQCECPGASLVNDAKPPASNDWR